MVSSIDSMRLWSQQAALKAFRETSDSTTNSNSSSSDPVTSLADLLYSNSNDDDDDDDSALSALIAQLQQQAMTGGATSDTDTEDQGSVDDVSSPAFMNALKDKIAALKASPDTADMADSMLAALDAGTLTVTDVVAGEQITAYDPADEDASKTTATTVDQDDWSSYLKNHLLRDSYGSYVRNDDFSHQDKVTGNSSYFGMIGDTYYYMSWSDPSDAAVSASGSTDTGN